MPATFRTAAVSNRLTLDNIPEAPAVAFSTFLLRYGHWKKPILAARRDNDNDVAQVLADISFRYPRITLNSPLVGSSATFGEFLGINSGLVKDWFDQGLEGRHASQANAAKQGRIASSGVLEAGILCLSSQWPVLALPNGAMPTNLFAASDRQWTVSDVALSEGPSGGGFVWGLSQDGNPGGVSNVTVRYSSSAQATRIIIRGSGTNFNIGSLGEWGATVLRWDGTTAQSVTNKSEVQTLPVGTNDEIFQPFHLGMFLNGLLGEIIVWAKDLGDSQISQLQNNQYSRFPIP